MAKKEVKTDLWVYDLLKDAGIKLEAQGSSSIKEIDEALKTASKKGTGNVGFPEYVGLVGDFLLVIEDKADLSKHIKEDDKGLISTDTKAVTDYAVNGAYFYGKHLINNTNYKKIIAFGISGNEKYHRITPLFINEREYCKIMPDVESFYIFNKENIDEYYTREVLGQNTDLQKETDKILDFAKKLHKDLRNYGNLQNTDKPLVVAGILLALREIEKKSFYLDQLTGDNIDNATDGYKIYSAIEKNLQRSNVSPTVKKDKLLTQFALIKDNKIINEVNKTLGKTPLKYYAEQIYNNIYKTIKYTKSPEDYLGRFYGEFMSYSGGDGQELGIILTPKHITQLFCDLVDLKQNDIVLDPCCGTAGFLIAAMHNMLQEAGENEQQKNNIRKNQLHGIEINPYMFTLATSNMIIRGDGKSNLIDEDFFKLSASELQLKSATVGMMNPPYSQGSAKDPSLYEISFVEHLLDSLAEDGRAAVIIPQSALTGKTKVEQNYKESILKHHTLEGAITLNTNTFYGVGTNTCIAVFTAHRPHPFNKECKFIDFKDDGFEVSPHRGLIETEYAKDKKQHLLDVWFNRIDAPTKFCVKSTIEVTDEWLHSFYYFNDEIPTDEDFEKTVSDYLSFEFSMIAQGKRYLFEDSKNEYIENRLSNPIKLPNKPKEWKPFYLNELFQISSTSSGIDQNKLINLEGSIPYITRTDSNNGYSFFIGEQNSKYKIDAGNSITIGLDTQTVFYQPSHFYTGQNIQVLNSVHLNKYTSLFIIPMIKILMQKFNWGGNGATLGRLQRSKILLPVTSTGTPDYEYMENYIKYLEQKKIKEYMDYINK